ncbi:hypothetical protein [Candidatus Thiosymbion oneisti]|uniref:hypothetical protein n=1 Tax=Candidatus Thiosymbion oneisti TaxID=589554 RepID=UPI000B7F66B6|nr:hypothetical protein [Candidatus Thiosymbion oneisti]
MDWIINSLVGIVMLLAGFGLDRLWEWRKKKKAGLTGQAHRIIAKLGKSVQSFDGYYFLSRSPTENFKIANHVYQHAAGEVIGTCFRENPTTYGEQDLSRLLPPGASFTRLTTDRVCSSEDIKKVEAVLKEFVPNSKIVMVPSQEHFTSIDGIFAQLSDKTHIALVTFPKMGPEHQNRGILFYGHIAETFFTYYRDLSERLYQGRGKDAPNSTYPADAIH